MHDKDIITEDIVYIMMRAFIFSSSVCSIVVANNLDGSRYDIAWAIGLGIPVWMYPGCCISKV
jgi:hypothetical protein